MESQPPRMPTGQMRDRVACLEVPAFVQNRHVSREAFAGRLQSLSATLDAAQPTGWVVDLRRNGGGDMWAMLAGLGPMLGEGPFGFFISSRALAWTYRAGAAFNDGRSMCRADTVPVVIRHAPSKMAVLIGPGTASAGEAVSIAFKGRPDTRSFGRSTAGQATANSAHTMTDGAVLAITAAVMADRSGAIHDRVVEPDIAVSSVEAGSARDATLDHALAWLAEGDPAEA